MPLLTAVELRADQRVQLPDGRQATARAGEWLITRGSSVLEVVGPPELAARYEAVDPGDRTLPAAVCARIEQTTGVGSTRTPEDLARAIERLAHIEIGGIAIDFTPGQLDEIKYRASKRGRTVQQELQAVIDRIREDLFWRS
jgi:hypothetical protein